MRFARLNLFAFSNVLSIYVYFYILYVLCLSFNLHSSVTNDKYLQEKLQINNKNEKKTCHKECLVGLQSNIYLIDLKGLRFL